MRICHIRNFGLNQGINIGQNHALTHHLFPKVLVVEPLISVHTFIIKFPKKREVTIAIIPKIIPYIAKNSSSHILFQTAFLQHFL